MYFICAVHEAFVVRAQERVFSCPFENEKNESALARMVRPFEAATILSQFFEMLFGVR